MEFDILQIPPKYLCNDYEDFSEIINCLPFELIIQL